MFGSAFRISYHFIKILRTSTLETCTWGYETTGTVLYAACQDLSLTWWREFLMTTTGHSGNTSFDRLSKPYCRLMLIYIRLKLRIYKCFWVQQVYLDHQTRILNWLDPSLSANGQILKLQSVGVCHQQGYVSFWTTVEMPLCCAWNIIGIRIRTEPWGGNMALWVKEEG